MLTNSISRKLVSRPSNFVYLRDPYIFRDLRGQTINITPFQYNPVENVLRVYTKIKINVYANGLSETNVYERDEELLKIDHEYKNIYQDHFINFNNDTRFDYLVDHGKMLIVSYGDFMDEMQPLVDWKNLKGIPTEIVDVASIGSNSSSIESYVEDYYNSEGLTFLLLVGDIAQMPSPSVSGSSSDVSYGCISGNDFYPEVIVGRFSGGNPSHIATQVERTIDYERYPQSGAEWYDNALGIASNQGPGFGGYTDDVFNEFLWDTVLSGFTYDSYEGIYDGSGGTDQQGINAINGGVSLINYTGHGSISSWGNGASLSSSQINALTNDNLLPFVITVGCNVGEFQSTNECFCESWMRATNNGNPTGSIAHFGSTISQSWEPPMHGQYGMNLIITESYDEHLTRSIGGITTNGCMYMNDAQGSSGINETKYWTLFGDPSTSIRTAPPSDLSVFHDSIILIGQDEFVVDVGEEGALVALSRDGELLSSVYTEGGVGVLQLNDDISGVPGEVDLVITGFNSFPYETTIVVMTPDGAYVAVNEVELNSGDDGVISLGESVSLELNVENVGSDVSNDITISLEEISGSPYVNIYDNDYIIESLAEGEIVSVTLDFTVSSDAPYGHSFILSLNMESESNSFATDIELSVESLIDSFESGDFADLPWDFSGGDADWTVVMGDASEGLYSSKSGTIDHNMSSELSVTVDIAEDGNISFYKKVSCEDVGEVTGNYYDYLAFYIDDVEQNKWAGEQAWSQNSFFVSEGEHTFTWRFVKDQGVVEGQDAVWVDHVTFPPTYSEGGGGSVVGDVNGDGLVSVLDIIVVVNMILGAAEPTDAGDTNQDGTIDVLDVVIVVNIILDI